MPAPLSQPEHGRDPSFDPYHNWLGIPLEEQPPNHYRLLGLRPFEDNPEVIDNAADQRMTYLRTLQTGKHILLSQRLLNEVAAARLCLLRADTKAAYDADLRSSQLAVSLIGLTPLPDADR